MEKSYRWHLKFISGVLEGIEGDYYYDFPATKIGVEIKEFFGGGSHIVTECEHIVNL